MDQDKTVNRILRDLGQFGLVVKDVTGEPKTGEYRIFLNALWVAAFEEGYRKGYEKFRRVRAVILYDKHGKVIKEYESAVYAAKKNEISVFTILSAIRRKSYSKNGNYWRWKEEQSHNMTAPQP
jgi:hypothetical protein